jgi:histone deacetylase 1/2
MNTPDRDKWAAAEKAEIQSLIKNKVFTEVTRPSNRTPIPCKWIYKRKKSKSGSVEKFKARLVAKGFHQIYGQDFNETFSPVARLTTIRLLYSVAVLLNLRVTQLDVETAFLNSELPPDEQVFVEPPPLLDLPQGKCYKLQRSLYGLKQSPRLWNNTINKFLLEIGFHRLSTDGCIYVKGTPNSGQPYIILALYVDDLILMSNQNEALQRVVSQLR